MTYATKALFCNSTAWIIQGHKVDPVLSCRCKIVSRGAAYRALLHHIHICKILRLLSRCLHGALHLTWVRPVPALAVHARHSGLYGVWYHAA